MESKRGRGSQANRGKSRDTEEEAGRAESLPSPDWNSTEKQKNLKTDWNAEQIARYMKLSNEISKQLFQHNERNQPVLTSEFISSQSLKRWVFPRSSGDSASSGLHLCWSQCSGKLALCSLQRIMVSPLTLEEWFVQQAEAETSLLKVRWCCSRPFG